MLHEIYCEQFHQKRIVFNPGLSVVLGTNTGDNSIGKSTFLLIVDYVFGGSTYAGTTDIIENVGSHDIYFSFIFGEETFKFCRNSINAHTVWKCNDSYEKVEEIGLSDYCKWLDSKYAISLPELSFRDAVGRYIRVYGKSNCDERRPLHYQATEKTEKACTALLKLFDAYSPLKDTAAAAQHSDDELIAYKKAQALQFIAKITKRVYEKNEKDIRSIAAQIEELSSGLERGLLDVDAAASEQAVYIKKLLSRARRARSKVKARWDLLDENGNYAFSSTTDSFADLQHFFPEAAVAQLDEIEGFHRTISSVFKAELRAERSKLEKELAEYDQIIHEYEAQLQELVQNPNLSKVVLTRHAELLREKDRMKIFFIFSVEQVRDKVSLLQFCSIRAKTKQEQFIVIIGHLGELLFGICRGQLCQHRLYSLRFEKELVVEKLVKENLSDDFVFAGGIAQTEIGTYSLQAIDHLLGLQSNIGIHYDAKFLSVKYSLEIQVPIYLICAAEYFRCWASSSCLIIGNMPCMK